MHKLPCQLCNRLVFRATSHTTPSLTSLARRALDCQRVSRLRGKRAHAPMRATWASCGRAATARSAADRSPAQLASHGIAPLAGPMARPRSRLCLAILAEFVASRLRACGASPASLPFAGRPLPPPASANLRAVLRRRDAGSSLRAVFAARAPNRVRPSLSARREAVPPAPHAKSFSRSARLGHTARRDEWRDGSRCVERRPESLRVFSRERRTRRDLASSQRFRAEAEAARSIDGAHGLPRAPAKKSSKRARGLAAGFAVASQPALRIAGAILRRISGAATRTRAVAPRGKLTHYGSS